MCGFDSRPGHQCFQERLRNGKPGCGLLFSPRRKSRTLPLGNYIDPERNQFEAFKALPRDEPVMMLNLLRFQERAVYPDGRSSTGRQAYETYGRESAPIFQRVGGQIIWRGRPEVTLIGPQNQHWDPAFIARYPTAGAFLAMVTDPHYRDAVKHRQAAVLDSRLICMTESASGQGFAVPQ